MKKVLTLVAICLGSFSVANAQYEPEKGDFAVEIGFSPFKTDGGTFKLYEDGDNNGLTGMLKARWFFSDKNALRLKLGLDTGKSTTTDTEYNTPVKIDGTSAYYTSDIKNETTNKNTGFSFMLGYERHLFTEGRFDVYAGLELGYELRKYSGKETEYDYTEYRDKDGVLTGHDVWENTYNYTDQDTYGNKSMNYFRGNLFAGVDVYVWKNLYLGAELGLAFKTGKSFTNAYRSYDENYTEYDAKGVVTGYTYTSFDGSTGLKTQKTLTGGVEKTENLTTDGSPVPNRTIKSSSEQTNTSFKFFVEPAIRIGWKF